jgi:hypothetical protein
MIAKSKNIKFFENIEKIIMPLARLFVVFENTP